MSQLFEGYEEYQGHLHTAGKSSHTTRAYLLDLQAFSGWFRTSSGEDFSPRAVDARDITEYRGYLLRTGVSPATVNRRLISLRRFFKWAHRRRLVEESPFDLLERVYVREQSQQELAPRWLDGNEQLALLRAVRKGAQAQRSQTNQGSKDASSAASPDDGDEDSGGDENGHQINSAIRDIAVIQTLLGTGLRISELANLRIEDVEVTERKGLVRVREGKGGKSRIIPLDNRTRASLLRYMEERKKQFQSPEQLPESGHGQGQEQRLGRPSSRRKALSGNSSSRQPQGPLFMGQRGHSMSEASTIL